MRKEIETLFSGEGCLSKVQYGEARVRVMITNMNQYVKQGEGDPFLFKDFEKFTSSAVVQAVKKNHVPPSHPFFDLCERHKQNRDTLVALFKQRILGLQADFLRFMQTELEKRKGEINIQSFDDLLIKLERALKKYIPNGTKPKKGKVCAECGSENLVYQEGCLTCTSCGSSKCG